MVLLSPCENFPRAKDLDALLASNLNHHHHDDARLTVKVVGKSSEGRDLLVLVVQKLGDGPSNDVLVIGGMHAREWITIGTVTCLAWDAGLLGEVLEAMEPGSRLILFPLLNPDGYSLSRTKNRHWRKTRSVVQNQTFGVDLNRNFGIPNVTWGFGNPLAYHSELYQGSEPFSEPEAKALRSLVLKILRPGSVVLDIHCCAKVVFTAMNVSAHRILQAEQLAAVAPPLKYRARSKVFDKSNTGISIDWMELQANVEATFMVELPGQQNAANFKQLFRNPATDILPYTKMLAKIIRKAFEMNERQEKTATQGSKKADEDFLVQEREETTVTQGSEKDDETFLMQEHEEKTVTQGSGKDDETFLMQEREEKESVIFENSLPFSNRYLPIYLGQEPTRLESIDQQYFVLIVLCAVAVIGMIFLRRKRFFAD